MSDGPAALEAMIQSFEKLGSLGEDAAPEAADAIAAAISAQIAAGLTPDGAAWAPTKTGDRALKNAAAAVTVTHAGAIIRAEVNGVEARHSNGGKAVKGGLRRQIIPERTIPVTWLQLINAALHAAFKRAVPRG